TRRIGGTGLGLALIREMIQGHRGRVWVESELGKGSRFYFTLPMWTGHQEQEPEQQGQGEAPPAQRGT
ncbi:MAG: hypothetical protein JNL62_27920, partial [Bryobacterales bacterium]|nr:hypothetical protein [Bryobacterales bacterium]